MPASTTLPGTASTATDFIPWVVKDDATLVCIVKQQGGSVVKEVLPLAEAICNITRDQGITEIRVVDHDVRQKMQACKLGNSPSNIKQR